MSWLVGSYVGTTENPSDVLQVQKLLYKEGLLNLIATPMGGNLMLLTTKDNSDVYSQLVDAEESLGKVFLEVEPWVPEMVSRVRLVWLRVTGTPIHALGEEFFQFLAKLVGKFVSLDEPTSNKARLDIGRMLVNVTSKEVVNRTVNIKVNDCVFLVRMVEEVFVDHLAQGLKVSKPSLDSGCSSDESEFVEDTFMGDPDDEVGGFLRSAEENRQEDHFSNSF